MEIMLSLQELLLSNPFEGSLLEGFKAIFLWVLLLAPVLLAIDKVILRFLSHPGSIYDIGFAKIKIGIGLFFNVFIKFIINPFISFMEKIDEQGIDQIKKKFPESGEKLQQDLVSIIDKVLTSFEKIVKKLKALKKKVTKN